ncbi:hypothetical protein D3C77_613510 [compost metagenome]
MQLELFIAVHADQHGNGNQAAGMPRQARAGPDIAPGMAGDHLLELAVELGEIGQAAIDMGIAKHRATHLHTLFVALFLVHGILLSGPAESRSRGG